MRLNDEGFSSAFIAGSQTQEERIHAMKGLKSFQLRVLVSTDVVRRFSIQPRNENKQLIDISLIYPPY